MTRPSLGRIVIVPMDPVVNNGAGEAPAVITRVWSDELVNVRILDDSSNTPPWRTSVRLHAERPAEPMHDAWWPPRV